MMNVDVIGGVVREHGLSDCGGANEADKLKVNDVKIMDARGLAASEILTDDTLDDELGMSKDDYVSLMSMFKGLVRSQGDVDTCTTKLRAMLTRCLKSVDRDEKAESEPEVNVCMQYEHADALALNEEKRDDSVEDSVCYVDDGLNMLGDGHVKDPLGCRLETAGVINLFAADFRVWKQNDGPLAGMISKGAYFEGMDSYWWQQQVSIPSFRMDASMRGCYYLIIQSMKNIVFERNGKIYLASLMQNYVFDPGGKFISALMSMVLRSSLNHQGFTSLEHVLLMSCE